MKNLSQSLKLGLLVLGIMSVSACSSSKVEETGAPVETADASLDQPASTDLVPGLDPALQQGAPDSLAATNPDASLNAPTTDLDAPLSDAQAPVVDAPIADVPVVEDAPIVENAVVDMPVIDTPVEAAPMVETPLAEAPAVEPETTAALSDGASYRVKKGDTLMKIAFEQYGDLYRWKEIYEANRSHIQDPNHVPPGTQLTLNGAGMVTIERNGESYLIKRGDTLGVISNDVYGSTRKWKKLWENNRQLIKDPNKIYAGFYLYYVPEGKKTLTHEDVAPGLREEDSAATAPKVSTAPRAPASVNNSNSL